MVEPEEIGSKFNFIIEMMNFLWALEFKTFAFFIIK